MRRPWATALSLLLILAVAPPVVASSSGGGSCPVVIAHRGASISHPENTGPAVLAAIAAGAEWVEVDIRFSKSDVPFPMHDEDIYRVTDSTVHRNVQDMWWYEITELDWGYPKKFGAQFAGTGVLTFYEWLVLVRDGGVNGLVELKVVPDAIETTEFATRIDTAGMWDKVVIQSFFPQALAAVKSARPQAKTILLESPGTQDTIRSNEGLAGHVGYAVALEHVRADRVVYWHSADRVVYAWTADQPAQWSTLTAAGVDGVITNDPAGLVAWQSANC